MATNERSLSLNQVRDLKIWMGLFLRRGISALIVELKTLIITKLISILRSEMRIDFEMSKPSSLKLEDRKTDRL
jgi:hypothetical protein